MLVKRSAILVAVLMMARLLLWCSCDGIGIGDRNAGGSVPGYGGGGDGGCLALQHELLRRVNRKRNTSH